MALGSTQPLTEMSIRNLPECKGRPGRKADNLTAVCDPIVYKMWDPRRLTTFSACYGIAAYSWEKKSYNKLIYFTVLEVNK
jgi:hypothetical protein